MTAPRDRTWVAVSVALLAVLAVVSIRVYLEAKRELASAQRYDQRGDFHRAIDHYRRALRWSFPLSPFEQDAVEGLMQIAQTREAADDIPTALLAWRSLLGGVSATRSLGSRTPAEAKRARTEISRLLAPVEASEDSHDGREDGAGDRRADLGPSIAPKPIGGVLLLFGFALWLASLVALSQRGFDRAGHPSWPAARAPLLAALAGSSSFVVGLFLA